MGFPGHRDWLLQGENLTDTAIVSFVEDITVTSFVVQDDQFITDDIEWYGALTNPEMTDLFGELGMFAFGWN